MPNSQEQNSKQCQSRKALFTRRKTITGIITIALFAFLIVCFILNGATNIRDSLSNSAILGNVYYVSQIIAAMAVIIGALVGVWQYYLTSKAERVKLNTDCIQRAIELSEYYKDNILSKYSAVKYVYERSGLLNIIQKIDPDKMAVFDHEELTELLSGDDLKSIRSIRDSSDFINAVLEADKIYSLNFSAKDFTEITRDKTSKEVSIKINGRLVIRKFMSNIVTETLNNLEFFAMHFSHGTADETVVYQSLHQTYLEIIYIYYYNIAIVNKSSTSKYYTNVIELYEKWRSRDQKEHKHKVDNSRNYSSKGNSVEKLD